MSVSLDGVMRRSKDRADFYIFAAIVLVAATLRILRINSGLWLDEGYSISFLSGSGGLASLTSQLWHTIASERLQPGYIYVLYAWSAMFGESEHALRILSILVGTVTVAIIIDIALRLWGPSAARWAGVCTACNSYLVFYSSEIRPYVLAIFLFSIVLDIWAADLQTRDDARPTWSYRQTVFCLVAMLLCFTSLYGFIPLVILALLDFWLRPATRRFVRFWLPAALGCGLLFFVIYAPALVQSGGRAHAGLMRSQGLLESIVFAVYGISVGQSFGPPIETLHGAGKFGLIASYGASLGCYTLIMALLIFQCAKINWRALQEKPGAKLLLAIEIGFCGALLTGALVGWVEDLNWLPRHAFYLAPLFILIQAALMFLTRATILSLITVCGLMALNIVAVFNMNFRQAYALDDYRGVAQYLKAAEAHGTVPILLQGSVDLLRDYYHVDGLIDGAGVTAQKVDSSLIGPAGNPAHVMVVINREYIWPGGDGGDFRQAYTSPLYAIEDSHHFSFFDLYELSRR